MSEGKPRILIVDDESDTLLYLFDLLSAEGFHVEGTSNAFEAVEYVSGRMPELVICDIRMPEMDGFELLARIKRTAPKTRVLLVSAFVDESMRQEALARGGEDLLDKTMSSQELIKAVGRIAEGVIR